MTMNEKEVELANSLSKEITSSLRKLIKKADVDTVATSICHLSPAFSSQKDNFRIEIRKALIASIQANFSAIPLNSDQIKDLLDLQTVPRVRGLNVSISHTDTLGGFVVTDAQGALGFDLEISKRVKPEIVRRVLAPLEALPLGRDAEVWCAKEAAVKSIAHAMRWAETPTASTVQISLNLDSNSAHEQSQFTAECVDPDVNSQDKTHWRGPFGIVSQSNQVAWALAWIAISSQ